MRILHVLDHSLPLHSGYSFRTISLLREQRARGWETFQLTSPKQGGGSEREQSVDGWDFIRTPVDGQLFGGIPVLSEIELMSELAHRIEQVVRNVKPHLLHAHSPVLNAVPAIRVARRVGIPVVYEVRSFWEDAAVDHGTTREGSLRYRATRALETWAIKRVDAVFTICEGLRNDIQSRGVDPAKLTVIPNAVDVEQFTYGGDRNEELSRDLGLEGASVLGFIGSFYQYEGLALLLKALPAILRAAPNVKVLLVGGGAQEGELRSIVESLGISSQVVFTGRVPHDRVQDYYNLVDIFVYPRLPMRLTDLVTPLKPLEAMAQGRLVVASDVGGHRELIRDGETGVLFRAGDPDALAAGVLKLLGARDRWDQLRVAGRRFVETERTWRASVANYASVYERLVPGAGV